MAVIDHIDGIDRRIYLHSDTVNVGLTSFDSFYREYRTMREMDAELQKFAPFLVAEGNFPKGGGKFTPRYIKLLDGCRIVPYNTSHTLLVTIEIITDDRKSGIECFDRLPLSLTTRVDIDYDFKGFEIIQVVTGSALTMDEHNKLMSIPNNTLNNDERTALLEINSRIPLIEEALSKLEEGKLSVSDFRRLLFNRTSTITNKKITSYTAGGDTKVDIVYDDNGIPISEIIDDN